LYRYTNGITIRLVMPLATGDKGFSVGFDPLDGSSIVDANFAVGKLFAVVDVS
jgi:fructose-1,6-bisphosphatase